MICQTEQLLAQLLVSVYKHSQTYFILARESYNYDVLQSIQSRSSVVILENCIDLLEPINENFGPASSMYIAILF